MRATRLSFGTGPPHGRHAQRPIVRAVEALGPIEIATEGGEKLISWELREKLLERVEGTQGTEASGIVQGVPLYARPRETNRCEHVAGSATGGSPSLRERGKGGVRGGWAPLARTPRPVQTSSSYAPSRTNFSTTFGCRLLRASATRTGSSGSLLIEHVGEVGAHVVD